MRKIISDIFSLPYVRFKVPSAVCLKAALICAPGRVVICRRKPILPKKQLDVKRQPYTSKENKPKQDRQGLFLLLADYQLIIISIAPHEVALMSSIKRIALESTKE